MDQSKLFYIKLKEQREASGISLEDISDFTKIDIIYLAAIEEGDFSCLPNVREGLFRVWPSINSLFNIISYNFFITSTSWCRHDRSSS